MTLGAIIIDGDGSLVEIEELRRSALNLVFAEAGLDWRCDSDSFAESLKLDCSKERLALLIRQMLRGRREGEDVKQLATAIHRRKLTVIDQLIEQGAVPPRPGIIDLVQQAQKEGVRLALATTLSAAVAEKLMSSLFGPGGAGAFDLIIANGQADGSIAPAARCEIVRALGQQPSTCLALESSRPGASAAIAAGITAVVTRSMYARDEDFRGVAAVVDDLPNLIPSFAIHINEETAAPANGALLSALRRVHAHHAFTATFN